MSTRSLSSEPGLELYSPQPISQRYYRPFLGVSQDAALICPVRNIPGIRDALGSLDVRSTLLPHANHSGEQHH